MDVSRLVVQSALMCNVRTFTSPSEETRSPPVMTPQPPVSLWSDHTVFPLWATPNFPSHPLTWPLKPPLWFFDPFFGFLMCPALWMYTYVDIHKIQHHLEREATLLQIDKRAHRTKCSKSEWTVKKGFESWGLFYSKPCCSSVLVLQNMF